MTYTIHKSTPIISFLREEDCIIGLLYQLSQLSDLIFILTALALELCHLSLETLDIVLSPFPEFFLPRSVISLFIGRFLPLRERVVKAIDSL